MILTKAMDCVIIASGDLTFTPRIRQMIKSAELIVCADGGARYLKALDILPHVLIGDFDSIQPDEKAYFEKNKTRTIPFPTRKDQTDSELCVLWAIEQQVTRVTLLGVLGSRMDHSLANIFLLKKLAEKNIAARIINPDNEIYLVNKSLEIEGNPGDFLSIVPISETVTGITLEGLEYPLNNSNMAMGSTKGISNRFLENRARISVKRGHLIVTKSKD